MPNKKLFNVAQSSAGAWWPGKEWHLCDVQARARGWQQTSLQTGDTAVCLLVFVNFDINVKSCCTIFGEGPFYFEDCC